jgi:hypothetical protein
MLAQDAISTAGPNFTAAVDGPNFTAAVDGPNFTAAVDGPTEASIESFLRRAFQPAENVT